MYTETQLSQLIADVEKEFTAHLAKAEEEFKTTQLLKSEGVADSVEPIAKAEEEKEEEREKPEAKESKEESKKEAAPEEKEKPKAEAEEQEAEAKDESEKDEEKPESHEAGEHCDYDDEDMEHMHKMYASMSKGELKAHHDAVRKALDGCGMEKCGDMEMAKSEEIKAATEVVLVEKNEEFQLIKTELETQKEKAESLQKSLDAVSAFLTKLVEKRVAPQGKAITSLEIITKSETVQEEKSLTKSEIDGVLTKKASDPSLAKSDRELINAYYLNGGSLTSISHLLK
jgi:hypothetical protein